MRTFFIIIFLVCCFFGLWLSDEDEYLRGIGEYTKADKLNIIIYINFFLSFIAFWGMIL